MPGLAGHDLRVTTDFAAPRWHAVVAAPRPVWPGPITQTVFPGTTGNDHFTGGAGNDTFNMADGGRDVVKGLGGLDKFFFGASLTALDKIDGGADSGDPFSGDRDSLFLDGNYAAGLTFGPSTMIGVETIFLSAGHGYNLAIDDATVAAADFLTVKLTGVWDVHDSFTFDGSAETNGTLRLNGGAGIDTLTGGALGDEFTFETGNLEAGDFINGGSGGFDVIYLDGDYSASLAMDPGTIKNIDVIYVMGGHDYDLSTADGNVAAGETLNVSAAFLETGDHLLFDGQNERDGRFNVYGGDDSDSLNGGRKGDFLQGNGGRDSLVGGRGHDVIGYAGTGESESTDYDTVYGFDFQNMDRFALWFDVTGVDTLVASGKLSTANFNNQMKTAVDSTHLGAHHAVVFTPSEGSLAGTTFLVIDVNGNPGYQVGDLVIKLEGGLHLDEVDGDDFII